MAFNNYICSILFWLWTSLSGLCYELWISHPRCVLIIIHLANATTARNLSIWPVMSEKKHFEQFQSKYFFLSYTCNDISVLVNLGCNVIIREGYIQIESPSYGVDDYPNDLFCSWTINDPEQRDLTLVFEDFYTEPVFDTLSVSHISRLIRLFSI